MFHLLVHSKGWAESAGSMLNVRISIEKDHEPDRRFFKGDQLDTFQMVKFPALLVTEYRRDTPSDAKVAQITHIAEGDKETTIKYIIDKEINSISNEDLQIFLDKQGLSKAKNTIWPILGETHWEIIDADLFKMLYLKHIKNRIGEKYFSNISMHQQKADLVSCMMPFRSDFDKV